MSGVSVRGLQRRVGDLVIDVPRLDVEAGGHLALFGPNGAGKSTLLRLIAGTLPGGPSISSAYLPQRPYAFRGSALHNLGLGLDAPGLERASALADDLGVRALLDRPARALSGGERQRLRLAAVLARPEPLVLLDEPLAPIDARERDAVGRVVSSAIGDRTSIVVTHDRDEAVMLADRLAVMVGGSIRQIGPMREVLGLPGDEVVAGVIGIANAHEGEVTGTDGALAAVDVAGTEVWGVGEVAGGRAAALFGAETVTVYEGHDAASGSARNRWAGRVTAVRPLGLLVEVVVDAGFPVVAVLTPGSIEALGLSEGSPVTVAVKATAVRIVGR